MPVLLFYHFMSGHIIPSAIQQILHLLPYNKQYQISNSAELGDKYRTLCGLYLLKTGLNTLGFHNADFSRLQFRNGNKPRWINNTVLNTRTVMTTSRAASQIVPPVEFSISHSHKLIICVLSKYTRVGIDAEYISHYKTTKKANAATFRRNNPDMIKQWTQKEAVIKAEGESDLSQINEVNLDDNSAIYNDQTWLLRSIDVHSDYIINLATDSAISSLRIKQITNVK